MAFYRGEGGAGTGNIEVQPIAIGVGGTGATTSAQARTNLGLGTAAIANTGDFATAAQGALADSAVQPADIGTAAAEDVGYFATAAQGSLADSAVQPGDLAAVATSGDYDDLSNKPSLFSGDYDDLSNKPSLFSGDYDDLSNKPSLFSGDYDDLTNKPTLVTALGGLSDVTITSATNGQTLQYNGSAWVNITAGTGTVTSVAATVPTGLTVSGSPITSSGTLAISYDTGYAIPTTAKQTDWDTAYGWGNHASAGYLTNYTETDPVVGAINGLVKANGSGTISAAVADTDYLTPSSIISGGTY